MGGRHFFTIPSRAGGAVLLAGLLLFGSAAGGGAVIIDRIVAVVNNEIITLSEVQELERSLRGSAQAPSREEGAEFSKAVLDKLIDKKLQLQFAARKGMAVSEAQLQSALEDIKQQNNIGGDEELRRVLQGQGMSLEGFKTQLKENILLTILNKREVASRVEISEEEVEVYYREHQGDFSHFDELRAQHILIYVPAEAGEEERRDKEALAREVLEKLRRGKDFAETAREYSNDPSAEKGGDLGYFRKGEILPALEAAALSLEAGKISPVIETGFGFHILKLNEYKKHSLENDPQIEEEIRAILFQRAGEKKKKDWLRELKKEATINLL